MEEPDKNRDFVASFARGLAVIQAFGPQARSMTLSEVAERTGLSRAAARRLLLTLCSLGFARSEGNRFELTPKILSLGYAYLASLGFWETARPFIEEVTEKLDESCSAAVLDESMVVYVARSAARHRIMSVALHVGTRLPAHATSMGQVLLAALEPDRLEAYLDSAPLQRHTRHTITDPEELRRRLEKVRDQGHALVDQELEEGLRSIAVPIRSNAGITFAALNVSSHAHLVGRTTMLRKFLPALKTAAHKIATHRIA
ncbi:MAG: helix-turn-helix domain-containing protein [Ectothiorhodospiraceae bacterium AqS1]|nr:helix-turn-helix domain-containing protein [Ectothiorhodospiraceae bacterium AqS1]